MPVRYGKSVPNTICDGGMIVASADIEPRLDVARCRGRIASAPRASHRAPCPWLWAPRADAGRNAQSGTAWSLVHIRERFLDGPVLHQRIAKAAVVRRRHLGRRRRMMMNVNPERR